MAALSMPELVSTGMTVEVLWPVVVWGAHKTQNITNSWWKALVLEISHNGNEYRGRIEYHECFGHPPTISEVRFSKGNLVDYGSPSRDGPVQMQPRNLKWRIADAPTPANDALMTTAGRSLPELVEVGATVEVLWPIVDWGARKSENITHSWWKALVLEISNNGNEYRGRIEYHECFGHPRTKSKVCFFKDKLVDHGSPSRGDVEKMPFENLKWRIADAQSSAYDAVPTTAGRSLPELIKVGVTVEVLWPVAVEGACESATETINWWWKALVLEVSRNGNEYRGRIEYHECFGYPLTICEVRFREGYLFDYGSPSRGDVEKMPFKNLKWRIADAPNPAEDAEPTASESV